MASWGAEATVSEGPVLSMMSKRLRALRKKHNRILQMEENLAQGKRLNKEQEEVLRSKPAIVALIDEYEKLRHPLAAVVQDELSRAAPVASPCPPPPVASREEALLTKTHRLMETHAHSGDPSGTGSYPSGTSAPYQSEQKSSPLSSFVQPKHACQPQHHLQPRPSRQSKRQPKRSPESQLPDLGWSPQSPLNP